MPADKYNSVWWLANFAKKHLISEEQSNFKIQHSRVLIDNIVWRKGIQQTNLKFQMENTVVNTEADLPDPIVSRKWYNPRNSAYCDVMLFVDIWSVANNYCVICNKKKTLTITK